MMLRTKSKLLQGMTITEIMIAMAIVALLASIAIPSFINYIRSSKTSEAVSNIRTIYSGEVSYFLNDKIQRGAGALITSRFVTCPTTPASVPPGEKRSGNWDNPNWAAVQFAQDSPVLFSYTTEASGIGTSAEFTARAEGDLDNDGVYSLFERTGAVNDSSGDIEASAGIYIVRDIE